MKPADDGITVGAGKISLRDSAAFAREVVGDATWARIRPHSAYAVSFKDGFRNHPIRNRRRASSFGVDVLLLRGAEG